MLKSAAAGLIDHVFVGQRVELRNNVVSCFTADEKSAERSFIADSKSRRVVFAAIEFTGGECG